MARPVTGFAFSNSISKMIRVLVKDKIWTTSIEKWQQAFEMNGIIANKEDLKVYQQFIKLLVKVPTSSNRINIIEMALDDASIAEGEALLMSDFC